jgi:hypothetical protein
LTKIVAVPPTSFTIWSTNVKLLFIFVAPKIPPGQPYRPPYQCLRFLRVLIFRISISTAPRPPSPSAYLADRFCPQVEFQRLVLMMLTTAEMRECFANVGITRHDDEAVLRLAVKLREESRPRFLWPVGAGVSLANSPGHLKSRQKVGRSRRKLESRSTFVEQDVRLIQKEDCIDGGPGGRPALRALTSPCLPHICKSVGPGGPVISRRNQHRQSPTLRSITSRAGRCRARR